MGYTQPVKRPDITGKMVTRHVRVDNPAPATARKSIPAPSPAASPKKATITKARQTYYVDIMHAVGHEKMTVKHWDVVRNSLVPLSEEELVELHETAMTYGEDLPRVARDFLGLAIKSGKVLEGTRTMRAICDELSFDVQDDVNVAGALVAMAARQDGYINAEDLSIEDDKIAIARAEVNILDAIIENAGIGGGEVKAGMLKGSIYLSEGPFKDFVIENADRGAEIARAIRSRCTTNIALIQEIMEHSTPALDDGIL